MNLSSLLGRPMSKRLRGAWHVEHDADMSRITVVRDAAFNERLSAYLRRHGVDPAVVSNEGFGYDGAAQMFTCQVVIDDQDGEFAATVLNGTYTLGGEMRRRE